MYVAENLRIIGQNTARGGGAYITKRYIDIVEPKPVSDQSAAEIVADVVEKAGLILRKGGGENGSV